MGFVIVLSIAECGIGLIAGSLPMLRHLFRAWLGREEASKPATPLPNSLVTFGGTGGSKDRKRFNNPTDTGMSRATIKGGRTGSGDWEQLDDGSSTGGGTLGKKDGKYIVEHTAVRVEYEMRDLHTGNTSKESRTSSTENLRR